MENKKLVIWDWNGTLLNDVDVCIDSMNTMLKIRNMPLLTEDFYKNIFDFPIINYYEKLGFNFKTESFEDLSIQYISKYSELSKDCRLHNDALDTLQFFKNSNFNQVVISAMEIASLKKQIKERNIYDYFIDIIGLDNIHAKSKIEIAKNFISSNDFDNNNTFLIGDTFHDYQVAEAINCKCYLVTKGHQNLDRFKNMENTIIIQNLKDLQNHLNI